MSDFRIEGAGKLATLGKKLKVAGDKELRKGLLREIRGATTPLRAAIKASAMDKLPKHGGVNAFVASSRITSRTRLTGKSVGVTIVGTKAGHDLGKIDEGLLRHPVFGRRKGKWVDQSVTPGFFTEPIEAAEVIVATGILSAIEAVSRELEA